MPLKKKVKKRKATKRKPAKKPTLKKKPQKKSPAARKPKENIIGIVTHYFPKVRAAVVKLKAGLAVGDYVKIKGHTTDFTQNVNSMQIDHVPISKAKTGQEIGLQVDSRVRQHDILYKP
jgi:putative protease